MFQYYETEIMACDSDLSNDHRQSRWHEDQKHMDVIRHQLAFNQLNLFLTTQLTNNSTNLTPGSFVQLLLAVLWQYYNMVRLLIISGTAFQRAN